MARHWHANIEITVDFTVQVTPTTMTLDFLLRGRRTHSNRRNSLSKKVLSGWTTRVRERERPFTGIRLMFDRWEFFEVMARVDYCHRWSRSKIDWEELSWYSIAIRTNNILHREHWPLRSNTFGAQLMDVGNHQHQERHRSDLLHFRSFVNEIHIERNCNIDNRWKSSSSED